MRCGMNIPQRDSCGAKLAVIANCGSCSSDFCMASTIIRCRLIRVLIVAGIRPDCLNSMARKPEMSEQKLHAVQ